MYSCTHIEAATCQNFVQRSRRARLPRLLPSRAMPALKCPLCLQTLLVNSEAECEAHIASCTAFRSEFGPGAPRSGLVSGFDSATSGGGAAPPTAVPSLQSACEDYAIALRPLVPIAHLSTAGRTIEEGAALIAHLAVALVNATPSSGSDDFGPEELTAVTLGPYLSELGNEAAKDVLAAIMRERGTVHSLCTIADACDSANDQQPALHELLEASLLKAMPDLRYCAACGKSVGCKLKACARCKAVRYCGENCQRKAWSVHRQVCTPTSQGQAGQVQ